MGAIEDTRKVLQDFPAPELPSITSRLDALESKVDDKERRAERRQVLDLNSIPQRLARLESKETAHQ